MIQPLEINALPHAEVRQADDAIAKWLLYGQIIGTIFFQKIAVPAGSGDTQLFLQMFIMFALMGLGLVTGRLCFRATPLALYLIMASGLILTQIATGHEFSWLSLGLILLLHTPYMFGLKQGLVRPGAELIFIRKMMKFVAVAGIAEFALQFAIGGNYAFLLDQLPPKWIMQHYNNLNILTLGSHHYKSNGFFMLEPSMFCQFLAISIIIEMIYFKSVKTVALYIAGILTTFSGTGLVILGCVVPVYLFKNRKFATIALIVLGIAGFIAIAPFIGMDIYVGRVNEFSNSNTSGHQRFLSIFTVLHDFILPDTDTMLFGMGAGANKYIGEHMPFAIHPPSWGKLWMEYGLVGLAIYMPLMIFIFFSPKRSGYLKAALFIQFFFDGYIPIPTVHALIIALLAWPALQEPEADRETMKTIGKEQAMEPLKPQASLIASL